MLYYRVTYQGSLQAGGVVVAATHNKQRFLLVQLLGQRVDLIVHLQHFLDLVWKHTHTEGDIQAGKYRKS